MKKIPIFLRVLNFFYFPILVLLGKIFFYLDLQNTPQGAFALDFGPLLKKVVVDIYVMPILWLWFAFALDYFVFQKQKTFFLIPVWLLQMCLENRLLWEKSLSIFSFENPPFEIFKFFLTLLWLFCSPWAFFLYPFPSKLRLKNLKATL